MYEDKQWMNKLLSRMRKYQRQLGIQRGSFEYLIPMVRDYCCDELELERMHQHIANNGGYFNIDTRLMSEITKLKLAQAKLMECMHRVIDLRKPRYQKNVVSLLRQSIQPGESAYLEQVQEEGVGRIDTGNFGQTLRLNKDHSGERNAGKSKP